MLGIPETHISGFKKGRPCSYQKHAQIAAVAGLDELATHILLRGIADSLSDDYPHEAQIKAALMAMLNAFPESSSSAPWPEGQFPTLRVGPDGPDTRRA